ncbi:hypothetical protein BCR42DRAFT_456398 [Absidia repens]|uniref:Heterokaryon incompatibility domain-containing protein n=1 Tax=Absidia repens TaxID=90262 RepID=A0A1X2I038_9FUNG|nr:hypothetical protein BCR42DRAFT_456398 [Absidia repens]
MANEDGTDPIAQVQPTQEKPSQTDKAKEADADHIAQVQAAKESLPQESMTDDADIIGKEDEPIEENLSQVTMAKEAVAESIPKGQPTEEKPFHVVLIDIKKAANENIVHCIEKPLMGSGDLKYVAVSYRWGELHETTVDTQLGYLASITSFGLDSFFQLCRTMSQEVDLKDMEYVWVDAICVDQTNYEKRKATIYQMTNIYERANYIVAVPDFHLRHLESVNKKNAEIIQGSMKYSTYIYHLIHGNTDDLLECDTAFLDDHHVPDDPHLRYLLTNYTEHFADGFTTCKEHDEHYDADLTLDHIYETNLASQKKVKHHHSRKLYKRIFSKIGIGKGKRSHPLDDQDINKLHKCDKTDACPITLFGNGGDDPDMYEKRDMNSSKHQQQNLQQQRDIDATKWKLVIPERSAIIRESMDFLSDLIQDWSTRVWVISEYHIAKKKKSRKMKYWFIQLSQPSTSRTSPSPHRHDKFFEFDFSKQDIRAFSASTVTLVSRAPSQTSLVASSTVGKKRKREPCAVFQSFHTTVQTQLNRQRFLEIMLKSKASRNEDRMHAILPLSHYKHKLGSKEQVGQWHITSLISVKLQLYTWANTKHQWQLLFLSTLSNHASATLPTFATSNIDWPTTDKYPTLNENDQYQCNFDLTNPDSIQLTSLDNNNKHKLTIKPKEYYLHANYQNILLSGLAPKDEAQLRRLLHLEFPSDLPDMLCIREYTAGRPSQSHQDSEYVAAREGFTHCIYLIGCMAKNQWILKIERDFKYHPVAKLQKWERRVLDANSKGFDIY